MSVNRKVTVPVGSRGRSAASGAGRAGSVRRRRRSSRPTPSTVAVTPSSATRLHRIPAGEPSGRPNPTNSAAATATAMTPLSKVAVITPGLLVRSGCRSSGRPMVRYRTATTGDAPTRQLS
jgi:hypothetical protein